MISLDDNQQALQCKTCQKVSMADGSSVWVCKECGTEHQPGEAMVVDATAAQAAVNDATAAPAAPVAPAATEPVISVTPPVEAPKV